MKKSFFIFGLLLTVGLTTVVFNSCGKDNDNPKPNNPSTDIGVMINGVKWATRNVDKP